jgi:hypothetical protein
MPITIARELTASLSGGKKITRSFANHSNYMMLVLVLRDLASTPSTFTYNGVTLTLVGAKLAETMACYIYDIQGPFEGVADVEVELSANTDWVMYVASMDGVRLFTPVVSTGTNSGGATPVTFARSITAPNVRIDVTAVNMNSAENPLAIAVEPQKELVNLEIGDLRALVSWTEQDDDVIDWTLDNTTNWAMIVANLNPAVLSVGSAVDVAVTATGTLTLLTRPSASVEVAVTATGGTPTVSLARGSRDYAVFSTQQDEEVEFANG